MVEIREGIKWVSAKELQKSIKFLTKCGGKNALGKKYHNEVQEIKYL